MLTPSALKIDLDFEESRLRHRIPDQETVIGVRPEHVDITRIPVPRTDSVSADGSVVIDVAR